MKSKYDFILFDLDGTLSRSAEGIRSTIEYTLTAMNLPVPDLSDYSRYIGPPLRHTFLNLCGLTNAQADTAVEIYRNRYNTHGKFMNITFDGTEQVLAALKNSGAKLAVASSKYEVFTKEIVDILNLGRYFDAVCGSNADETRKEKQDLIPYAVEYLGGSMSDKVVMIGDTYYDTIGAKLTGADFIGVTYGYGSVEKMRQHGAKLFVDSPSELLKHLTED